MIHDDIMSKLKKKKKEGIPGKLDQVREEI